MRREYLAAGLILVALAVLFATIPYWPGQQQTTPTPQTKFVGIQHAVISENDTRLGVPTEGYEFASFGLIIMNCGYDGFQVSPSLFELVINGTIYQVSEEATAKLVEPMYNQTVTNGQEIRSEVAYEIPANSVIPDAPLVYKLEGYTIRWTNNW